MSKFEIFLTQTEILHEFKGDTEKKVDVVSIEEYINKKYINNEKLKYSLYYKRQIYSKEKNIFFS